MLKSQFGFVHILVVVLLVAGILGGTYLVQQKTNVVPQAQELTINPSSNDDDFVATATLPDKDSYQSIGKSIAEQLEEHGISDAASAQGKPNIVVIITDDQPTNSLGIAGNSVIKTPNIDALAKPGMYFKNMYVPEGICSPSRASIWTGKLPHVHGVTTLGLILPPDQLTLPEILQTNGYNTALIGKCHLGDPNDPQVYTRGFDYRLIAMPDNGTVPDWYNYNLIRNGVSENHQEYITDYLTDQSIDYVKNRANEYKQNGKPFFLWLAQPAPHPPTIPPKNSNRYSLDQIQLPPSVNDDLSTKPLIQRSTRFYKRYQAFGKDGTRAKLKDAYEVVSNLDDNVGRLTKALDDEGIRDNTIIVYVSDNSVFFGEHQLFQKGPFFYEEQVKVPFIFSYPKLIRGSTTTDALASTMDIMPTLLNIIGLPIPNNIQGKSFLSLLQGNFTTHRKSVYFEYPIASGCMAYPMRGVVMDGFKWTQYFAGTYYGSQCAGFDVVGDDISLDGFDFELYDLKNDPYEMNNLMKRLGSGDNPLERMLKDQTYGKIVQNLRKERAIWATDTLDSSRFILSDSKVNQLGNTSLEVNWNTTQGNPTAEVEYKEKNCSTCPTLEYNDFAHTTNAHKVVLNNLKPNTTYQIRAFSFGERGVGGYLDFEGTTPAGSVPSPFPSPSPSIAPTPFASPALSPSPSASIKVGDLNNDGVVNIFDFNIFVTDYRSGNLRSDLNKNGKVDIFDFSLLLSNFGK